MRIDVTKLGSDIGNVSAGTLAASNLLLATPQSPIGFQPQNFPTKNGTTQIPPAPILFHYEGEQSVRLSSEITDHYAEDNDNMSDHIALKPVRVTTRGYIGELNDIAPKPLQPLKMAAERLTTISGYLPVVSETALRAYNQAAFLYSTGEAALNTAVAAWKTLYNIGTNPEFQYANNNVNKQQSAFLQFFGYWKERRLFTVQTPWIVFPNMAIEDLRAIQDEDTTVITGFEVTFKQFRMATTNIRKVDWSQFQSRLSAQGAPNTDNGVSSLPQAPKSLTQSLAELGR